MKKKAKKKIICVLFLCGILALLGSSGCKQEEKPVEENPNQKGAKITFSNLADEESVTLLKECFRNAEIPQERQDVFFQQVEDANRIFGEKNLQEAMEEGNLLTPKYDPYALQDLWTEAYQDFPGYNCRITAFSLFEQNLKIPEKEIGKDEALFLDLGALEEHPEALGGKTDAFRVFYADIPTEMTKDISKQVKIVQNCWKERGIAFQNPKNMSLISVFFHSDIDDPSVLQIGHTGILFPGKDGNLYFLEKVAFQEPYQLVKLKDRAELNRYLMTKYDVTFNQPTADPFIMENDQLMEGYGAL